MIAMTESNGYDWGGNDRQEAYNCDDGLYRRRPGGGYLYPAAAGAVAVVFLVHS